MKRILLVIMMLGMMNLGAKAQNSLYISNFTIAPGETKTVTVNLDNATQFSAIQWRMLLPEGLTIQTNALGRPKLSFVPDRIYGDDDDHALGTNFKGDSIQVVIYSTTSLEFLGNSGPFVTFNVTAADDFTGSHEIILEAIEASTSAMVGYELPNSSCTVTSTAQGGDPGVSGNSLYINDFNINPGETKTVTINLDNETQFSAIQWRMLLPEGLTIQTNALGRPKLSFVPDRIYGDDDDHALGTNFKGDSIQVVIYSTTSLEFLGNSGPFVTFNVTAADDFTGSHEIILEAIEASTSAMVGYELPNSSCTVTSAGGGTEPGNVEVTSLVTTSCDIPKGLTVKFNVGVNPSNAENKTLVWTSSDNSIATVAADGTIETLEMGAVTITATTTDGSNLSLNYVINVTESQSQPAGNSLDVNGDGFITSTDITMIYNYLLGN